jgi:hypothetical protein
MAQTVTYVITLAVLFGLIYGLFHKVLNKIIRDFDIFPTVMDIKRNNFIFNMYAPDFKKNASFKLKVLVIFNNFVSIIISIIIANYIIRQIF